MDFLGNLLGKKEEPKTFGQESDPGTPRADEQSGIMGQMNRLNPMKLFGSGRKKPKKTKKTKKPKKQTKYKRN